MNTKVVIKYDGSDYYGWQDQKGKNNSKTIEEVINKVVSNINKEKTEVIASGRTDRGVHALHQVFNFNNIYNIPNKRLKNALNDALPDDIIVLEVESVADDFHARFSAKSKEYHYYLNMGEYNMFERKYINQYNKQLDIDKMLDAKEIFIGKHDFSAFNTTPKDVKNNQTITILKLDIEIDNNIVIFKIVGTSFLRHMVRMIVGSLLYVGANKIDKKQLQYLLDNPSDYRAPFNIEASGLYLYKVNY